MRRGAQLCAGVRRTGAYESPCAVGVKVDPAEHRVRVALQSNGRQAAAVASKKESKNSPPALGRHVVDLASSNRRAAAAQQPVRPARSKLRRRNHRLLDPVAHLRHGVHDGRHWGREEGGQSKLSARIATGEKKEDECLTPPAHHRPDPFFPPTP